jgi:hypothetical protein
VLWWLGWHSAIKRGLVTERDYMGIARAIHEASQHNIGWTAQAHAFEDLAETIADLFAASDNKFDRDKFISNCGLVNDHC